MHRSFCALTWTRDNLIIFVLLSSLLLYSVRRKLKRLNIGGNELNRVPTGALQTMDNLKKLEIQENKITTISEGDFIGKHGVITGKNIIIG